MARLICSAELGSQLTPHDPAGQAIPHTICGRSYHGQQFYSDGLSVTLDSACGTARGAVCFAEAAAVGSAVATYSD